MRSFAFLPRARFHFGAFHFNSWQERKLYSSDAELFNKSAAAVAQSVTVNGTVTPMSRCAASSRAGGLAGGPSRTTVPLLTDLKLVFSSSRVWWRWGWGGIDASRPDKGQLLPASGQFEQNVSSVLTSTPSAVLVHVKTRL